MSKSIRRSTLLAAAALTGCNSGNNPSQSTSASARSHPDFTGVWSGAFTTQQDQYWELEDLTACLPGCTPTARAYYTTLIEDPANDSRPVQELWGMTIAFMREELAKKSTPEGVAIQNVTAEASDPNLRCAPHGLARAAVNPLPVEIRQDGDNLTIAYEERQQSRTIFMDGRKRPAKVGPTRLGHSVGRYDGEALVIETTGVEPNLYYASQSGGGHSAEAKFVERYAIADDPRRLELDLTITDPVTLLAPHVLRKVWLATPEIPLGDGACGEDTVLWADVFPAEAALEALRQR